MLEKFEQNQINICDLNFCVVKIIILISYHDYILQHDVNN